MEKIVVSGVKPSGELHIGNFLGAVKNFLALQNKYQCYFFVADLHSLTETFNPQEKEQEIKNLVVDLLALGLNPEKCVFFIQSHVPQCLELAWIFSCLTPVPFLQRMTQYKDFIARQDQSPNAGLLTYPVLQAADILLYHGNLVPVGKDQLQHIELTNDLARTFNRRFGKYFELVQPYLTDTPKIMSLTDPNKKMSKSLGPKNYIALRDEPEVIFEKIKKAPTGTGKEGKPTPGAQNLLDILTAFGQKKLAEQALKEIEEKTISYLKLKEILAKTISDFFGEFRKKYKEIEQQPEYVEKILQAGQAKASQQAEKTIKEVKKIIGLI